MIKCDDYSLLDLAHFFLEQHVGLAAVHSQCFKLEQRNRQMRCAAAKAVACDLPDALFDWSVQQQQHVLPKIIVSLMAQGLTDRQMYKV